MRLFAWIIALFFDPSCHPCHSACGFFLATRKSEISLVRHDPRSANIGPRVRERCGESARPEDKGGWKRERERKWKREWEKRAAVGTRGEGGTWAQINRLCHRQRRLSRTCLHYCRAGRVLIAYSGYIMMLWPSILLLPCFYIPRCISQKLQQPGFSSFPLFNW